MKTTRQAVGQQSNTLIERKCHLVVTAVSNILEARPAQVQATASFFFVLIKRY